MIVYGGIAWNTGARDETAPPTPLVGRLMRAQANYYESLPLFVGAVLGCAVAGRLGPLSAAGAWLWLVGRVIYLPLYWAGVPKWRTAVWGVGTLALLVVLGVLLLG